MIALRWINMSAAPIRGRCDTRKEVHEHRRNTGCILKVRPKSAAAAPDVQVEVVAAPDMSRVMLDARPIASAPAANSTSPTSSVRFRPDLYNTKLSGNTPADGHVPALSVEPYLSVPACPSDSRITGYCSTYSDF